MLMEDGKILSKEIPEDVKRKFERANIEKFFQCAETTAFEPLDMSFLQEEK